MTTSFRLIVRLVPLTFALAACGDNLPDFGDAGVGGGSDASEPVCERSRSAMEAARPLPTPLLVERYGKARPVALPVPRSELLPPLVTRPLRSVATPRGGDTARATRLHVLLITPSEEAPSFQAAQAAFERMAVPYEVLVSTTDDLTDAVLYGDGESCRYAGVVLSNSNLVYYDGESYMSSLSDEEWDRLGNYEVLCNAREAVWYAYPSIEFGLVESGTFNHDSGVVAALTSAGQEHFPYLVPELNVAIEHVYGYRSVIADSDTTTPLVETTTGDVLAAIHTRPNGTEVLAMTADSGTFSQHSQLLEFGIIDWLSRGLFIGKRRAYLAPHIDDLFLETDLYSPTDDPAVYRMTAADLADLRSWTSDLQTRLPSGSTFVTQMAFNGDGTQPSEYPDTSLADGMRAAEDEFYWINHTWDHANMDEMRSELAEVEIGRNCELAEDWQLSRWHCSEAVTPQVSGLDNPDAVAGMLAAGVRYVVSDTSITEELNAGNPGTNPSHNVGRRNPHDPALFQVPRYPTNIFFNCSNVAEEVGLYNQLYSEFWGKALTYQEILEVETDLALSYLLTYSVNPIMFHQANLRFWDNGQHSLYTDWVDLLVERYTALVDLPILGLDMTAIATVMQEREALDRCGVEVWRSADGTSLRLESTRACVVPITGLDAPAAGDVESYGGVPTTHVSLSECDSVDVSLPL